MAYSQGPYERFGTLPVPPRPTIHSARSINYATKRIETDPTTGGFIRTPPTAQRVALLISFEVEESKFITEQEQEKVRQQIFAALSILTAEPSPQIKIKEVVVGSDRKGQVTRRVVFIDLTKGTGNDQSVQI
jgi:hypothetical protein